MPVTTTAAPSHAEAPKTQPVKPDRPDRPERAEPAQRVSPRLTATDLAAATPVGRDRTVDLLRVSAIAVVVIGHWLMAVVSWRHGKFTAGNLLQVAPATQWSTWALQVMPLFFLVGGYANAASWTSARRRMAGYPAWLHGRVLRLVRPIVPLVAAWTIGLTAARMAGANVRLLHTAARLVAMPLWFLAVYAGVVAMTPVMLALHDRYGLRVVGGLAGAALVVDTLAWHAGLPLIGWANFAFVWLCAHQLGFVWRDQLATGARRGANGWFLVVGGLVTLAVLTQVGGYPRSMVGGPGARSNNTPPSLALVALAVVQLGIVMLARPALHRWLRRPRVWRNVVAANGAAMTLFLWHLTALCLASIGFLATGWFPQPPVASLAWWLLRPAWLMALAAFLAPLVAAAVWVERQPVRVRASRVGLAPLLRAATGAVLVAASLAVLSALGLPTAATPGWWLSTAAIPAMGSGVALIRSSLLMELTCPAGRSDPRAAPRRRARWSTLRA